MVFMSAQGTMTSPTGIKTARRRRCPRLF